MSVTVKDVIKQYPEYYQEGKSVIIDANENEVLSDNYIFFRVCTRVEKSKKQQFDKVITDWKMNKKNHKIVDIKFVVEEEETL